MMISNPATARRVFVTRNFLKILKIIVAFAVFVVFWAHSGDTKGLTCEK